MTDILERIENRINDSHMDTERLLDDCAAEIRRLRAGNERLSAGIESVFKKVESLEQSWIKLKESAVEPYVKDLEGRVRQDALLGGWYKHDPNLLREVLVSLHSGEPTADNQITARAPTKFNIWGRSDRFRNTSSVSFKIPPEQPTHFAIWLDDKIVFGGPVECPSVERVGTADTLNFGPGSIDVDLLDHDPIPLVSLD